MKIKTRTESSPNGRVNEVDLSRRLKPDHFAVTATDALVHIDMVRCAVVRRMELQGHPDPGIWWGYMEPDERGYAQALCWVLGIDPRSIPDTYATSVK